MPIPISISDYIVYGRIGAFLAANDENNFVKNPGGTISPSLSREIYIVTQALEWKYNYDPTSETLTQIANYLYALVGNYVQSAKMISGYVGGSTFIIPPSGVITNLTWEVVEFTVPDVLLLEGGRVITIMTLNPIINTETVVRNNVVIYSNFADQVSYSIVYSATQIVITLSEDANASDTFRITFTRYSST